LFAVFVVRYVFNCFGLISVQYALLDRLLLERISKVLTVAVAPDYTQKILDEGIFFTLMIRKICLFTSAGYY